MKHYVRFFCLICLSFSAMLQADESSPKVVVIGAGLSGLTTAYRLDEKGFNVEVYEARNRVGGRIFTAYVCDHVVELGGQNLLDGGDAENVLALVDELDLETEAGYLPTQTQFCENGKCYDVNSLLQAYQFNSNELKKKLVQISLVSNNMLDVLHTLFHDNPILISTCASFLAGYEGVPPEKLSTMSIETLYNFLISRIDEENMIELEWVVEGNGMIAEKLAQKLNKKVHLNSVLKAIKKTKKNTYLLTFQNGEKAEADILVLTIPCSTYDNIEIGNNVIPMQQLDALKKVQYGTNAKIAVPIIPSKEGPCKYVNEMMATYPQGHGHIVHMYLLKDYGRYTAETISDTYKAGLPLIAKAYEVIAKKPPVIAKDCSFASYDGPVGHSWPNDPFAKGSYSCVAPGQEAIMEELVEIASEPVKKMFYPVDDTLFFAGEHTCVEADMRGTIEGAVESGERTARIIFKTGDRIK